MKVTQYLCDKCGQPAERQNMITARLELYQGAHDDVEMAQQYPSEKWRLNFCHSCCSLLDIPMNQYGYPSTANQDEPTQKVTLENIIRTMVAEEVARANH